MAFLILLFFALKIRKSTISKLTQFQKIKSPEKKLYFSILHVCKRYVMFLFCLIAPLIVITVASITANSINYLLITCYCLLAYIIVAAFIDLVFYPFSTQSSLIGIDRSISGKLANRLKILLVIGIIGFVIYILLNNQIALSKTVEFAHTLLITILAISIISIAWPMTRIILILRRHPSLRLATNIILTVILISIVIAEWLGYRSLTNYLFHGIAATFSVGFLAWILSAITIAVTKIINSPDSPIHKKVYIFFGVSSKKTIFEFGWLAFVICVLLWSSFIVILLKIWGLSSTHFRDLLASLVDGFKIANITIVPSKIILSLFLLAILLLFIRACRKIIDNPHTKENKQQTTSTAISAIVNYIGVAITILIVLLIAGVNFAGLAIIAGALSVGIGFGLQNIVNNFVSGIILLIERPIKPGDRIIVGENEGFVKKISIRSTRIQTLKFSDIIIPNAEIISGQLTNLMFNDYFCRIHLDVGVAYGTDAELVNKILLETAKAHKDVIDNDPVNQPSVFFLEFGSSSMLFKLFCVIKNVNSKFRVRSELHFAVYKAFKENGIAFAFPQRDIHIYKGDKQEH